MTALDWNSALEKEAPVEFMHVPQPCACALSCLCCECRAGPSEPPPLDVWSGLMFTVLLTECWRIWADMSPQCSLPDCLPDWLCSHIPSVRRHLWRGWATVCCSLACVLLCLSLTLRLEQTPAKRQGFLCGQRTVYQQINVKKTRKGLIHLCVRNKQTQSASPLYLQDFIQIKITLLAHCIIYEIFCLWGQIRSFTCPGVHRLTVSWCSSRSMRSAILLLNST